MSFRVLVGSSDPAVRQTLEEGLGREAFQVLPPCPSGNVVESTLGEAPDILVYDIAGEQDSPRETVRTLRKARPGLRIIILSEVSPVDDSDVLDEGIFCHVTKPAGRQLAEVVEAAGRVLARRRIEEGGS